MPKRFGVQFKLVWFYYAQRRAGRPRSSPFPLRGELMWYNEAGCPRSSPFPLCGIFFSCREAANSCGTTRTTPCEID
ncbi:MAG: hypothetical protein LBQ66_06480 [Planctomycetaceae bacterium]|nr:hypothetical protein [Planctomycetaceae bacterium]